jgi:hypothetical protein
MLESEEVIKIIKDGVSARINLARDYSTRLNMHVTGLKAKEHAEIFNFHESKEQRKIREKLLKSNKRLFSFLLRPLDKVFTAKGGNISYNLTDAKLEELKNYTSEVSDGLKIKEYLKKKVKLSYIIDPNGFIMVDIDQEGQVSTKIFNTNELHYYTNKGNKITSVIFNPYTLEEDEKQYYRVIDDLSDSIYVRDGDVIYQDEDSIKENFLQYVPAYILGDIYDYNTELFLSLIDDVLEDADEVLRDVSVKTVHKLSQGFAKYWQYYEDCNTCAGTGEVNKTDDLGDKTSHVCHTCKGTGVKNKKDASDVMMLPIPDKADDVKIAPEVAGYINPSIEIWEQYKKDIKDITIDMFQSLWGTTFSVDTKNETATGRLLNVQPQAERVTGISKTFSNIHEFLLSSIGAIALQNKDYKADVSYGTRYLMESPDEVLKRYQESKEKGLPAILQNDLLDKFYQTEYSNNNTEYLKTKKILSIDPFPSMTAKEVKELGVNDDDLKLKIYYPQWVSQLTEAKKSLMTKEELLAELTKYVINKTIKNERTEV